MFEEKVVLAGSECEILTRIWEAEEEEEEEEPEEEEPEEEDE